MQNIIQLFENKLREEDKSIYTIIAYKKDIEQYIDFCAKVRNKELRDIDAEDIKAFIEDLKEKGYTMKSISRKLNSIRTFSRFALESKYIDKNPAHSIPHPKFELRMPRVLTTQEYKALRDTCRRDQRLYSIVELLLQTGMKIGELCRLSLDDIIYENGVPVRLIIRAYESTPEREVILNEAAANAIIDYLKIRPQHENSTHLFLTKYGKPMLIRNVRFYLDRAFKKAGIENATVNDLRNTFIAHHLARGTSILFISKMVGHKRLSTTERYANLLGLSKLKPETLDVL
jgi:site-specific recombinase XerD